MRPDRPDPPIHEAIRSLGRGEPDAEALDRIADLLAAGACPNAADRAGSTALHWAACLDQGEALAMLLRAGGDPNLRNKALNSPATLAADMRMPRAIASIAQWRAAMLAAELSEAIPSGLRAPRPHL